MKKRLRAVLVAVALVFSTGCAILGELSGVSYRSEYPYYYQGYERYWRSVPYYREPRLCRFTTLRGYWYQGRYGPRFIKMPYSFLAPCPWR